LNVVEIVAMTRRRSVRSADPEHRAQESLILRRPEGASKDEAGAPAGRRNGCKEQRCGVSFEAILRIAPQDERPWRMPPEWSTMEGDRESLARTPAPTSVLLGPDPSIHTASIIRHEHGSSGQALGKRRVGLASRQTRPCLQRHTASGASPGRHAPPLSAKSIDFGR